MSRYPQRMKIAPLSFPRRRGPALDSRSPAFAKDKLRGNDAAVFMRSGEPEAQGVFSQRQNESDDSQKKRMFRLLSDSNDSKPFRINRNSLKFRKTPTNELPYNTYLAESK